MFVEGMVPETTAHYGDAADALGQVLFAFLCALALPFCGRSSCPARSSRPRSCASIPLTPSTKACDSRRTVRGRDSTWARADGRVDIAQVPGCLLFAYISTRFKDVKLSLIFGFAALCASAIMLAVSNPGTSTLTVAADALGGFGFAALLTLLFVVAQLVTPPAYVATSSALLSTARAIGGSVGTASYNALFTAKCACLARASPTSS